MVQTKGIISGTNSRTGLSDILTGVAIGDPQGPGLCHRGDVPGPGVVAENFVKDA